MTADTRPQLREAIAATLSTLTTCDGQPWPSEFHYRQADALLAGPLADLATLPARVRALADEIADVARDYRHAAPGSHDAGARDAHLAFAHHLRALTPDTRQEQP